MKRNLLLLATVLAVFQLSFGQSVITFQPSGGLNDGTDSGTANGGKDTWTTRYTPSVNDGAGVYVLSSPRSTCNTSDYKSYFQFDVSTFPDEVDSVFFGVTHTTHDTYCYSNCIADFYFYYVTSPWDEMSLIQTNEPSEIPTPFYGPVNISFPNDFGMREYDITDAYNYWKTEGVDNYGFATYSTTSGCNNASVGFYVYSSDDTLETRRPYLKIYYTDVQTAVNDGVTERTIHAWPNPFGDQLKFNADGIDRYYLVDLTGRVMDLNYDHTLGGFNTVTLQPGIYILNIENGRTHAAIKVVKGAP